MPLPKRLHPVVLRAAEILSNPDRWCHGWRNWETNEAMQHYVKTSDYLHADRVCMLGAVRKANQEMGRATSDGEIAIAAALAPHLPEPFRNREVSDSSAIMDFNDATVEHAKVHQVYCALIKAEGIADSAASDEPKEPE